MTQSPTYWLPALQNGDEAAAERFWQEYFLKTVRLARKRMEGLRLRAADEEDVALSAMKSFCQMARKREDPIAGSEDLWKLLATIVRRKVNKERQRQFAEKRQEYRLHGESVFASDSNHEESRGESGLDRAVSREPSPELAMSLADTWESILAIPGAGELVLLKNEGYSNSEIAQKLGCSTRKIQRDLEKIYKEWTAWQEKAHEEWSRSTEVGAAQT